MVLSIKNINMTETIAEVNMFSGGYHIMFNAEIVNNCFII